MLHRAALFVALLGFLPTLGLAQTPQAEPVVEAPMDDVSGRPSFPEDGGSGTAWTFAFHGYARMALRLPNGQLIDAREPYLIDDDYYRSGFAYTRVNETEWAELFLSAARDDTRFVVGLFASGFSDWKNVTLEDQKGIATAFVEQRFQLAKQYELRLRAGMFWDRFGFIEPYDTYVFGRTHVAGLALNNRFFDRYYLKIGYGAHADVLDVNQGFSPVAWSVAGVDLGWLDTGLYALGTWTHHTPGLKQVQEGSLEILGADVLVRHNSFGKVYGTVARYRADKVSFLSTGVEALHSTGGRNFMLNILGKDSEYGTGEVLVTAFDSEWSPYRSLRAMQGADAPQALKGLNLRLFGMTAYVLSKQKSDDPIENRNDRLYIKWGADLSYRIPTRSGLFVALRYDRVILDADHEDLSFRIVTPRIGIQPTNGLDVYIAYSRYFYGDRIEIPQQLKPEGESSEYTQPDESVLKLQAQMRW